jgi:putative flippase GtrA
VYSEISSVVIANLTAGIFSIAFNYFSHYSWSFKSQDYHSFSGIKYLLNLLFFWLLNTLLLKYFIEIDINPKIAKLMPILFIAPLSFLSLKFFVFRKYNL